MSAEYHVSRRKYSDAEEHFKECFAMLEAKGDYHDPELIETVRRYVQMIMKAERKADQVTLGELFKGSKLLTDEELTAAWQFSKKERIALGHALTQMKLVSDKYLQIALQMLVRNNEISSLLAVWLMLYMVKLNMPLDAVLELFQCEPKSRTALSGELKSACNEMANMEARLSPNHSELAFAHAKVAHIYFQRQQWTEAEHHFKRAMEIIAVNPNVNAEKAIEVIDHYRDMKLAQEDWEGTVKVAKIGVLMRSKHYGQTSIPYAKGLERLAQIFCQKGDHTTAISCLDRALAVREKLYGNEDRELLGCLEARGDCFMHMNDYTDAESTFERAVAITIHTNGKHHDVSDRLIGKLAEILKLIGKVDRAREIAPGSVRDHFFI
jgi:tetratricopeptide (TPR) repeat protein